MDNDGELSLEQLEKIHAGYQGTGESQKAILEQQRQFIQDLGSVDELSMEQLSNITVGVPIVMKKKVHKKLKLVNRDNQIIEMKKIINSNGNIDFLFLF